mmetsp:Transcript_32359/g.86759  ORF Transcript_32359/g.86759 Transcript_32359/m.86759 type:complete len:383 (-) Transcript_32359:2108-3256(-)
MALPCFVNETPLLHSDAFIRQLVHDGAIPFGLQRALYTNSETSRRAIKNKLGTNRNGHAHCLRHGRRTVDPTVLYEGGLAALSTSVCTLHDELVPHDHHVALSLLIRHVGALQEGRQDINWRVRGGTLRQWRIVQQAKPRHEFDAILGQVTAHSLLQHTTKLLDVGGGTPDQLRDPFLARHCCREFTTTLGVQKPDARKGQHAVAEALVPQCPAEERGCLREPIQVSEGCGVPVGQDIEHQRVVQHQGLHMSQQIFASDIMERSVSLKTCRILRSQKHTLGIPTELIRQRAAPDRLGCWKTTTDGGETQDATALGSGVTDHLHGTHVINAWIQAHLVDEKCFSSTCLGIKGRHLRTHVRRSDHGLPVLDREPRDANVQGGWQ